jgi:lipoprotein NlpI
MSAVLVGLAAFVAASCPVLAASERDWNDCKGSDPDRSIAACTRILQGGGETTRNRAIARYDRGLAYDRKGDHDRAIADFSEAIRLDPKYAEAYSERGFAYRMKGDLDRAVADYTEAIRLDPKDPIPHYNRGIAYRAKGDLDRAVADFNEAIRLEPKDAIAYRGRGLAYLYAGNPAKALADVSQATELDPKNAHHALWLDIVGQRNNVPSRLSQAIANIDMTAWPAPVIRLFLGQTTPAAVLAAADDPDATKKKGQVCEANFFSGELALRQGGKNEAARLFRLAASECSLTFIESDAANAELKALGAAR